VIPLLSFTRRYGLRYVPWYVGGTLMLGATNWFAVTIPMVVARAIDAVAEGPGGHDVVLRSAGIVAGLGVATIVVRTLSRLLFFTPGRLVESAVQRDLFQAVLAQQPTFLAGFPVGDLMSRMSSDVQLVRLLYGFTLLSLVNTVVAVGLTGAQMARISAPLALASAVPLFLGFLVMMRFVGSFMTLTREIQERAANLSEIALASFQGIATVHAFGGAPALVARLETENQAMCASMIRRSNLRVAIGPVLAFAASLNVFVLLWFGGPRAIDGTLSVGDIVAFTALAGILTGPLRGMSFILSLFKQSQAAIERLDAVLLAEPQRPDLPRPLPAPTTPPELSFRGMSFRWPGADRDTLRGVDATVHPGGVLGIFGATGSGKSTLLRCLMRLEDPPPGTIFANGVDVRSIDLLDWRRCVVLVPQRAFLFSETLADNVLLGAGDPDRLADLLDTAQLTADLAALPHGTDTLVGEAGLNLSGGQRQRAALARGLARDAKVLVLDDVLSAVDHTTERALMVALRSRPDRPTTVIVANRISALRHADVIVVLDKGAMVARGTHDELVGLDGPYREACVRQSEADPTTEEVVP
jgi:ATP-binding cassette subfamily B protein